MENNQVVLPDTLVAQLIDNAATLTHFLQSDYQAIIALHQELRQRLLDEERIIRIQNNRNSLAKTYAIDGAHIAEVDRASAYSISCAVKVGQANQPNGQSSCLAVMPHVASLNSLSSGLMTMQEIMMAVQTVEEDDDVICLIDGSRISAIIAIQSFYSGISRDMALQLRNWRENFPSDSTREPGRIIHSFESRNWMTPFLTNSRIIGNLKLVTTNVLVNRYSPQLLGRFDDKTFASIILEAGEAIKPLPMPPPDEPYHIHSSFPFTNEIERINNQLTQSNNPSQLFHIYYRPDEMHGVYKIELNLGFLTRTETLGSFFTWFQNELKTPDLQEPYSNFIADRFAKEAVSVAKKALKEITRRDISPDSLAWSFESGYRTD